MNTSFESGRSCKGLSLLLALCLVLSLIVPVVSAASRDFTGAVTNRDGSVLEARLPVLAAGAGSAEYVPANGDCVLQLRVGADGKVPVYYTNGLLVGIPVGTKVSDGLLKAPDGKTLSYSPDNGVLSTGTVVTVSSGESYTLVTYGDINGDSVLDALDATMIQRYVHHHRNGASAAQLEAALIDDDDETEVMDFSMFVNLSVSNEEFLKNQKKPLALCTASTPADGVATGSAYCPAMTVSEDGVALSAGDYTLSYSSNTASGTGTVTATAAESSEYVGELSKSFTIYSLDGVGYPDTLLANTGAAQTAALTGLTGGLASFTPAYTYNGSATAPSAAGVYRVGATFTNSDGTSVSKTYGSMIIAPASTGDYGVDADNDTKTVTVRIKKPYNADTALATDFGNWASMAESASVGGTAVTASNVISKLQSRTSFTKYYNELKSATNRVGNSYNQVYVRTQQLSNVLGCLLAADDTLWADNLSVVTRSITVNGCAIGIKLQQDPVAVQEAEDGFVLYRGGSGRGQRGNSSLAAFYSIKSDLNTRRGNMHIYVADSSAKMATSLGGTGLKTAFLAHNDSLAVKVSKTQSFTGSKMNLYDSNNQRYSSYDYTYNKDGLQKWLDLFDIYNHLSSFNDILTGMGFPSIGSDTQLSSYVGKTGYMNYYNASYNTGLRYNSVCKVEFTNKSSTDVEYTLATPTAVNGTYKAYDTANDKGVFATSNAINSRMQTNELLHVVATPASGYVLDKIQIVNASGTVLTTADANGDILMPASNGTLQVTFKPAN